MTVRVVGPGERWERDDPTFVNVTSQSLVKWQTWLSPFKLGPVDLYKGAALRTAQNVENAWQFAKVYPRHVGTDGNPTSDYFLWASEGWSSTWAHRYPMGKGAIPAFSWWGGQALDYISARKAIYIPLYAGAVRKGDAFVHLKRLHATHGHVTLWDYDGYDHTKIGMSLEDVTNCKERKMGHAFVLAMLLENHKL
ncbi:MAG: hypothetical protein E6R03_09450 [Hyphomicrobiaceae bacterium]|nr:MAG: hypothetical protein E6R03_09450 [Hyphomicrobiaceae bacterium]